MKVIKIGAMWCPACIIMNKYWNDLKNENSEFSFIELDLDMDEEEVTNYNVGDILPVIILLDKDKEIKRLVGEKTKEEVLSFLRGDK